MFSLTGPARIGPFSYIQQRLGLASLLSPLKNRIEEDEDNDNDDDNDDDEDEEEESQKRQTVTEL